MKLKRIGIVGAGIMASGMAQNFLRAGYEVMVWNRSQQRLKPLLAAGVTGADSPKKLTQSADIVIECVSDDEASKGVWLGGNGILAGSHSGVVLITSATLSLAWADELAALCRKRDVAFLDMPLTGGRGGAESGQLSLLVGGDAHVLDDIRPELGAIATTIFHFGAAGAGMRFKLMLNTLSAIHINAAAQAVELAKRAGIEPDIFYKALFEGSMGPASPATNILLRDSDLPNGEVNFAVRWIEKDLRYAQAMAKAYGASFDLLDDTHDDYQKAMATTLADEDWSKIGRLYRPQDIS